ncbi:flagellar motor protein MotB [Sphingomonas endophytica]|uniref:Flagellar motor protein n=1 Tax=Sphingomonas endophytica TaxID=869719 RepID=A0A147I8M2_9SPHN|nr:flagellar motor protein MotB [Sphingomonas endophytica]KTT75543.1 flagellar motor protein [Sphingomonas endophytica]
MAKAPHGKNEPPKIVIVKKITVVGGGHHGGAWKVAYADFVTAMMAFFLLLWLLGATTEKQRKGIADYFAPTLIDKKRVGIGGQGIGGGESLTSKEKIGPKAGTSDLHALALVTDRPVGEAKGFGQKGSLRSSAEIAKEDAKNFKRLREEVMTRIAANRALAKLAKHIRFTMTQDGMRIDLVDDADYSMFAVGTTALASDASELIGMVSDGIREMPNPIMIRGHTDSLGYGDPRAMNNWMLSSGRAEATRRRMALAGIPESHFNRIEGVADREPMIADNPMDPRNRRVAITLLYRATTFGQ